MRSLPGTQGPALAALAAEHATEGGHLFPVGGGCLWFAASAPDGFLICDGSAASRTTYADLFAVLGTTWGVGDGSTTFNLPDLRQRFPLGKAASGTGNTLAATGGAINHTHSIAADGDHEHDWGGVSTGTATGGASYDVVTGGVVYAVSDHHHDIGTYGTSSDGSHDHGGASGAGNPPFVVVNFVVRY